MSNHEAGALARRRGAGKSDRGDPKSVRLPGVLLDLSTVALCLLFWAVFKYQISPAFSYGGLIYRPPNIVFFTFAVVMAVLVIRSAPRYITQAGELTLVALVYMVGIPAIILPNIILIEDERTSFGLASVAAAAFVSLNLFYKAARPYLATRQGVDKSLRSHMRLSPIVVGVLLVFTAATFIMLHMSVGITFAAETFGDLYDARSMSSEAIATSGPLLGYALAIQYKAINPALIVLGFVDKRYRFLILIGVIGQYIGYTTSNQKQSLFSIAVIIALAVALRSVRGIALHAVSAAVLLLCAVASLADLLQKKIFWSEVIVDRFFFWPGFLPSQFHATFQERPFNLWSDAFMKLWIPDQSPGWTPETLVGLGLTGNTGVNANSSFLGNGYANLGFTGVLIEGIVLFAILIVLSWAARGLPPRVSFPLCVMPAVSLANGSPWTAILSGGVLVVILLLVAIAKTSTVGES